MKRKTKKPKSLIRLLRHPYRTRKHQEEGYILVAAIGLIFVIFALFSSYSLTTKIERIATVSSADSNSGFYNAEAGLNLRAEDIRQKFVGYNQPSGTSPTSINACMNPSGGTEDTSNDFRCKTYQLSTGGTGNIQHKAFTYVVPKNNGLATAGVIPRGEPYQNLNMQEYGYQIYSVAQKSGTSNPETILEMDIKSRFVPMFQFAAFYANDLEMMPSPNMNFNGPVHTNGNLYLGSDQSASSLNIIGQVTAVKSLYNKHKEKEDDKYPPPGKVTIADASNTLKNILDANNNTQTTSALSPANLTSGWGGQIKVGVDAVTIPPASLLNAGGDYYNKADLQIQYKPDNPLLAVPFTVTAIARCQSGEINCSSPKSTSNLSSTDLQSLAQPVKVNSDLSSEVSICPTGPTGCVVPAPIQSITFYNNREEKFIKLLQLDMKGLAVWNKQNSDKLFKTPTKRDDSAPAGSFQKLGLAAVDDSEGGLVFYATIDSSSTSPDYSSAAGNKSPYGFAITGGSQLLGLAKYAGATLDPTGITIASDQAIYIQGDYNNINKQPAAVLADSVNVLSNACLDSISNVINCGKYAAKSDATSVASDTTINTAFLAGTDETTSNNYNGGLENYPRFHENWQPPKVKAKTLTFRGSFVSLGVPSHVKGRWGTQKYAAPIRNWDYNTDFNQAENLPPLTPRFVYLKQEQFVRSF